MRDKSRCVSGKRSGERYPATPHPRNGSYYWFYRRAVKPLRSGWRHNSRNVAIRGCRNSVKSPEAMCGSNPHRLTKQNKKKQVKQWKTGKSSTKNRSIVSRYFLTLYFGKKMEENNYKEEIVATRVGGLGSSDAKLVAQVGRNKEVGSAMERRVAQMLGYEERPQVSTAAMRLGDRMEQTLFQIIKERYPQAVSNPYHEVDRMTYYGCKIFNHIDVEVVDGDVIRWYEIKASKKSVADVKEEYSEQLQWHMMVLKDVARKAGKRFELFLCHYQTEVTEEFRVDNLNIVPVKENSVILGQIFDGLIILKTYLAGYEYKPAAELCLYDTADDAMIATWEDIAAVLAKVAEMNEKIKTFKAEMLEFMKANGYKRVFSELITLTLVPESTSTTFDTNKFKKEHPELAAKYTKTTKRSAYLKETLINK